MFEIVEKARSGPSIFVAGIGRRGGEALRDLHDSGTPGVTRYVVIEEQSADCTGSPADSGFALSPDQADPSELINLDEGEILEGQTRLTCTPSDRLRAKIERAFRGADVILLIADMESRVGRSLGPDIAQLASEAAAVTFGVAIVSVGEDCADAGAKERLSRFNTRARAGTIVSCGGPGAARGVESATRDVKSTRAATPTEIYACVARGFVEPLLWSQVFPDVRVALHDGGRCFIGWGSASGENRARHAVEAAIAHTQLGIHRMATARCALVTLRGRLGDLCKDEMREVIEALATAAGSDLWIMPSAVYDEAIADGLHVSILAISGQTP